ncbi:MAG: hypothetical protein COU09_00745 [Candidatus Harrisonbacteria bacterium CG10_big_fil_rev_8_21_14_0_10_44_23]|uniref:DHHA1 domain-containing protein n=1 Tax=Candidatus Harrisonbacteria bacterium CG10_big_fil_rev_8_21_14_0_10_44_23 TaxID=1974585 RepID=A0A2H0UQL9_9BACT|nr:MAG: hypothetical protein COU09_00745 [Candidatus Harrisonbacteria bacterium CG10_big_fil_rev_8_21_14_0_10_44_23]
MQVNKSKKILVFYHADCADGFSAAWVAWLALKEKAQYISLPYSQASEKKAFSSIRGRHMYFLDMCPPEDVIRFLNKENQLTIIDHHAGRKEVARLAPEHRYAQKNSGAVLTWKYFFPKKPTPYLLRFIEDRDLFAFKITGGEGLGLYLETQPFDFKTYSKLAINFQNPKKRSELRKKGQVLLTLKEKYINSAVKRAVPINFDGHRGYLATGISALRTSIGVATYKKYKCDLVMVLYLEDNHYKITLRAPVGAKINLTKIAQKYGGGGHQYASAFHLPLDIKKFPWKYLKKEV